MIKLYDTDSYMSKFSATVTGCEKTEKGYKILCDKTAFFPTAGGQDCDTGTLAGQRVIDVIIENEEVFHIVKNPIEIGTSIEGKIDFPVRLRKMQHHSAEHIVSGIANKLFGVSNVGFHLGETDVTIDYDKVLTDNNIREIETSANKAVCDNLPICAWYPDEEELLKIPYRSKLDLTENVRIVEILGVDFCACCAPHVKSTGEIGVIKLKDFMHHRGGTRVRMICGADAVADYQEKAENALKISNLLSEKQEKIAEGVEKVLKIQEDLKRENLELKKQVAKILCENFEEASKNICIFLDNADNDFLRIVMNEGVKKCKIFATLSGNDADGYSYVLGSKTENLRELSREINEKLSGRGGGREDMISGKFMASKAEIEKYFKE